MGVLSDRDLAAAIESGRLKLEGWSWRIGPASIDLYLSDDFIGTQGLQRATGVYELQPFGFVLGSTVEFITLADDLCAQVAGCSSVARTGLQVECAGWVDPGFQGQLTAEIFNQTAKPYLLVPGMRIAQLVVFEMTSPAERPYGSPGVGRYQHQRGATPARSEIRTDTHAFIGGAWTGAKCQWAESSGCSWYECQLLASDPIHGVAS